MKKLRPESVYDCSKFHGAWLLTSYKTDLSVFIYSLMDSGIYLFEMTYVQGKVVTY